MIYLLLAIASSTLVSVALRLSEGRVQNKMGLFLSNYLCCMALALFFMGGAPLLGEGSGMAVGQGLFSGFLYLASLWLMEKNMECNGIVLTSAFAKLGVLVPTLMAIVVFHEMPTLLQLLGMAVALVAIAIIYFEKGAFSLGDKKLLLLCHLLVGGMTDSMANIYDKTGPAAFKEQYIFYTFFAAFLLAGLLNLKSRAPITKKEMGFGLLVGLPNYFSARFLLLALGSVPAVITYPVYSVATIVAISLVGVLFFKESISKRKAFALVLVMAALCLLNL